MKLILFLSAVNFLASSASQALAQNEYYFSTPDSSTTICVEVDSSKFAEYLIIDINRQEKIFERELRYAPMIKWIDNNYAEFFLPSGSPNYSVVYYSKILNKVSNEFPLAINFDPKSSIVATLDFDKINFHRAFDDNKITELKISGLEPISFLVFCDHSSSFNKNGFFEFSYECKTQEELDSDFPLNNSFVKNISHY